MLPEAIVEIKGRVPCGGLPRSSNIFYNQIRIYSTDISAERRSREAAALRAKHEVLVSLHGDRKKIRKNIFDLQLGTSSAFDVHAFDVHASASFEIE